MTKKAESAALATEEEKRELIAAFDEMVLAMGVDVTKGVENVLNLRIGPQNLPVQFTNPDTRSAFMLEKLLADKAATSAEVKKMTTVFRDMPRGLFKRALRETLKEMPRIRGGGRHTPHLYRSRSKKTARGGSAADS